MSVIEIIGLVLGSAATVEIIRWAASFRKTKAETKRAETETDISVYKEMVGTLMEPLKKRVDELEARTCEQEQEITHLQKRVQNLYAGIRKLIDQIVDLGGEPCWEPKDE